MTYSITAVIVLFGWIPLAISLFALLPPRRAATVAIIGGWLFLPPISIPVSGLPDFTKTTAATIGILLGTVLFQPTRIMQFRPKWFDLPMIFWCACPMASSLSNGLGPYDGLSSSLGAIFAWGFAYFIGRLYFGSPEGLRELCYGMIAGGIIYVPLCLYEVRMSPTLLGNVYGVGSWQGLRLGGYRPNVFFRLGLELGMWMTAVSMVAWWMWRSGAIKKWNLPIVGPVSFGTFLLPTLLLTTLLCRSTGAMVLLFIGVAILWLCGRFRTALPLWCIICVVCLYIIVRVPNLWSGQSAVDLATALVGPDRAQSLEFRFLCENKLLARAFQRPIFGWGGYGRNVAYLDDEETFQAAMDGLWIITFGTFGGVGLFLLYSIILLPVILMIRRFPASTWTTPEVAPAAVCATLLCVYLIDLLMNGFINLIYIVACGGLTSAMPNPNLVRRQSSGKTRKTLAQTSAVEPRQIADVEPTMVAASKTRRAEAYANMAKLMGAEERADVAITARRHSLDLLGEAWILNPEDMAIRKRWCDCANDLAWFLSNHANPLVRKPDEAVELASRASMALPDDETYWNTLGAARFRAGDFQGAIAALDRSIQLGGGTGFDYGFLAMAHAKLGDLERAEHWLARVIQWTAQERPDHPELNRLCDEASTVIARGPATPATTR